MGLTSCVKSIKDLTERDLVEQINPKKKKRIELQVQGSRPLKGKTHLGRGPTIFLIHDGFQFYTMKGMWGPNKGYTYMCSLVQKENPYYGKWKMKIEKSS